MSRFEVQWGKRGGGVAGGHITYCHLKRRLERHKSQFFSSPVSACSCERRKKSSWFLALYLPLRTEILETFEYQLRAHPLKVCFGWPAIFSMAFAPFCSVETWVAISMDRSLPVGRLVSSFWEALTGSQDEETGCMPEKLGCAHPNQEQHQQCQPQHPQMAVYERHVFPKAGCGTTRTRRLLWGRQRRFWLTNHVTRAFCSHISEGLHVRERRADILCATAQIRVHGAHYALPILYGNCGSLNAFFSSGAGPFGCLDRVNYVLYFQSFGASFR